MPRLILSTPALRDLAEIEDRIEEASGSSETAKKFVGQIVGKCNRLAVFETRIGRIRPELLPDLRSFPYRNYVIYFSLYRR
jgi:toxin ParE1/3/4